MHIFINKNNPNSGYVGERRIYPFVDGKYETNNPDEIKELSKVFNSEEHKPKPAVHKEAQKPDVEEQEDRELKTTIPKSWTVAKIFEYADSVGVTLPDGIVTRNDIVQYLEDLAKHE